MPLNIRFSQDLALQVERMRRRANLTRTMMVEVLIRAGLQTEMAAAPVESHPEESNG